MGKDKKTNVSWYGYTDNRGKPQASLLVKILIVVILGGIPWVIVTGGTEESEAQRMKKIACDCVEEFEAYRFYSEVGELCMDYAISQGKTDNPYGYFQDLCEN